MKINNLLWHIKEQSVPAEPHWYKHEFVSIHQIARIIVHEIARRPQPSMVTATAFLDNDRLLLVTNRKYTVVYTYTFSVDDFQFPVILEKPEK